MATTCIRETILVIEDEPETRGFASRVCDLEGYRVLQAEDGDTGLKLAEKSQVSLVLLDLRLPGRDGWSVLEQLKSNPELSSIPIVVFTASAAASQRNRALAAGASDYLVKPLSANRLRKAIISALPENR